MPAFINRFFLALRTESHMTVGQVFDLARQEHYTGEVIFHLAAGKPRRVEVHTPLQAAIVDDPGGSSGVKPLDK